MSDLQIIIVRTDSNKNQLCFKCAIQAVIAGETVHEKVESYQNDDSWFYLSECDRCKDQIT